MLDAIKYLPAMSYDVLTWAILAKLAPGGEPKIKVQYAVLLHISYCLQT